MPTITVSEDTFRKLSQKAAALRTTVDDLAQPALEKIALEPQDNGQPPTPSEELSYDEWKRGMDAWQAVVESRAGRYPTGHVTDSSRESIYEGCGE